MAPFSLALVAIFCSLMLQHGLMKDEGRNDGANDQAYLYHKCLLDFPPERNLNNTSSPSSISYQLIKDAIQVNLSNTLPSQPPAASPSAVTVNISSDSSLEFGLRFCRGDVPSSDCDACLSMAEVNVMQRCHGTPSVIWYDHCELKLSDNPFFGQVDHDHGFTMVGKGTVSDPRNFNAKVHQLLFQLAGESFSNVNPPKYFAKGAVAVDVSTTVYGLTQCSPDLSSGDCWTCLQFILGALPSCCDGKDGGRVAVVSCNFRYEIYPF